MVLSRGYSRKMKKLLKDWKWQELLLLFISISIIIVVFFIPKEKNVISLIVSILGVITVLMCSKGLFYAPFLDFIYIALYIILAIKEKYYGEVIIYILIMIPLNTFTLVEWFKNRKEGTNIVTINKVSKKEWFIVSIISVIITFIFYFILKLLNTSQLIVSTISLATSIISAYLLLRRSSYYAIGYITNDIVLIILWSLSCINGNLSNLPLVISLSVFLINDSYGLYNWKRQEIKQKEELIN